MAAPHVSLESDMVFQYGAFHITNSVLASYLVSLVIILFALYARKGMKLVPSRIQLIFEMLTEFFIGMLKSAYGSEQRARKFFPFIMTIFLFLLVANQFSMLPLVSGALVGEAPAFRTPTSDWNQTAALALLVIGGAHIVSLSIAPFKHIGNYIKIGSLLKVRSFGDLANALLEIFLGLLDIIGEFSKIISISARLFGNIFAGEVMIAVISSISAATAYAVPIPFIGLSAFSSLVQAFVFTFLAIFFMAGTITAVSPPAVEKQPA